MTLGVGEFVGFVGTKVEVLVDAAGGGYNTFVEGLAEPKREVYIIYASILRINSFFSLLFCDICLGKHHTAN
jgi:hypothetical protein